MKYKEIISFSFMLILLSGCSLSDDSFVSPPVSSSVAVADRVKMSINEYVTIDAETATYGVFERDYISAYTAKKTEIDIMGVKESLLGNCKITESQEHDNVSMFFTEKGDILSIERRGNLFFTTKQYTHKIEPLLYLEKDAPYFNGDVFMYREDLPFMSKEEIEEDVLDFFCAIGMPDMQLQAAYALSQEKMRLQQKFFSDNGIALVFDKVSDELTILNNNYSEEDDCYIFDLSSTVGGVPVISSPHGSPDNDTYVIGTTARVCISRNGIEFINLSGHYTSKVESTTHNLISISSAIDGVAKKYNNLIINTPIVIDFISLVYVPEIVDRNSNEYIMTPAWCFNGVQEVPATALGESSIRTLSVLINALSGKEIL